VRDAIAEGACWVWGPTYSGGRPGWELPLPDWWPACADVLRDVRRPLVLATGHLGAAGRQAFAALAAEAPNLTCSVTHSLYVPVDEIASLKALGALFEVDLYTGTRAIAGRPDLDLPRALQRLLDAGLFVYLVTDTGQLDIGDPYVFSAAVLDELSTTLGEATLRQVAVDNPRRVVAGLLGDG
jgi:hypothetical protein